MRWIPFLIIAYLLLLLQSTVGHILTLESFLPGPVAPDFLVLLAVFVALNVRSGVEGMLAGWTLGMLIDLTTAGAAGDPTRVGPMGVLFAMGVWIVFSIREAIFRERAFPQMLLAWGFCIFTHSLWVYIQATLADATLPWPAWGGLWLQILLSGIYTAILMPLIGSLLYLIRGTMLISSLSHRRGRISRG